MLSNTSVTFDFQKFAAEHKEIIESQLRSYLTEEIPPQLWEAMRYSVLSGGKRLRALLCLACAECTDSAKAELAIPLACTIELVHAMSLIHDDLPCMDDDDFRRGRPANHKVFGEATALLAGDGLLAYVFELLVKELRGRVASDTLLSVIEKFAHALGPHGMVAGQAEDLALTGDNPAGSNRSTQAESALLSMHSKKTGALISFSAWSGATVCGADATLADALRQYGEILGLAFQITDDLLDVTGDMKALGKTPGKDLIAKKTTWVSVWGIERSKEYLSALQTKANQILLDTRIKSDSLSPLKSLLQYAIERNS